MQKKIIEEPIFEIKTIQTGVNKKEVWITSDGKEFDNEKYADAHEFYDCKVNRRGVNIPDDVTILDLHCIGDLERYEKDYTYRVDHFDYDKQELSFPNTYVLIEEDETTYALDEDEYSYPEIHLKLYTVEQFKALIIKELDEIKSI